MRFTQIRYCEGENGLGVGCSLFVQGCHFHCPCCFNESTWDFNGGLEWTPDYEDCFMKMIEIPNITRVSILGGEPCCPENYKDVIDLIRRIKDRYPDKKIWLYTGYAFDGIDIRFHWECDYIVDGLFIEEQKDISLKFRGSRNQTIWEKDDTGKWFKSELNEQNCINI